MYQVFSFKRMLIALGFMVLDTAPSEPGTAMFTCLVILFLLWPFGAIQYMGLDIVQGNFLVAIRANMLVLF